MVVRLLLSKVWTSGWRVTSGSAGQFLRDAGRTAHGLPSPVCSQASLRQGVAFEPHGSVYSCDHFSIRYRLGNFARSRSATCLLAGQVKFGYANRRRRRIPARSAISSSDAGAVPENRFLRTAGRAAGLQLLCLRPMQALLRERFLREEAGGTLPGNAPSADNRLTGSRPSEIDPLTRRSAGSLRFGGRVSPLTETTQAATPPSLPADDRFACRVGTGNAAMQPERVRATQGQKWKVCPRVEGGARAVRAHCHATHRSMLPACRPKKSDHQRPPGMQGRSKARQHGARRPATCLDNLIQPVKVADGHLLRSMSIRTSGPVIATAMARCRSRAISTARIAIS